jgi:hypothetical protein
MTRRRIEPNLDASQHHPLLVKGHRMTSPTHTLTRRRARLLSGATLAVIGSVVALSGGGLLAAFGTNGTLGLGSHLLSSPSAAIVSPVSSIKHTSGLASLAGQPALKLSATPLQGGTGVFVGVGRAADVDRYLSGAATEQVTDLSADGYAMTGIRHGGRLNATPPAAQRFWVAKASSDRSAAQINWKVWDGQYRVVVMNTNGHGGVAATTAIAVTVPHIAIGAIAALLVGLLIAGGGTLLLIRATAQLSPSVNPSDRTAGAEAHATTI